MSDALTNDPGPEANLGYLFRLAHQRFRAALEDALQEIGLSAQEYVILSVFETRPELSTSELARITQVTRQTMHTAVLGLETAGLLERRPKNQRVVLVRPTKQGLKTLTAAPGPADCGRHRRGHSRRQRVDHARNLAPRALGRHGGTTA
jgi:DNA-binding MarR family transcriptional regulator